MVCTELRLYEDNIIYYFALVGPWAVGRFGLAHNQLHIGISMVQRTNNFVADAMAGDDNLWLFDSPLFSLFSNPRKQSTQDKRPTKMLPLPTSMPANQNNYVQHTKHKTKTKHNKQSNKQHIIITAYHTHLLGSLITVHCTLILVISNSVLIDFNRCKSN